MGVRTLLAILASLCAAGCGTRSDAVVVFGAASTAVVLEEAVQAWSAAEGTPVVTSYGSSSWIVRQIEAGAGAHLLLSADEAWADRLQADARTPLLGNALVVIGDGLDAPGCVAVGDPTHVPGGRYAEAALRADGRWEAVLPRLRSTVDAPAAVQAVRAGACPTGIAYRTDAARAGVAIGEELATPDPIAYPLLLLDPRAASLYAWLQEPAARAIYTRHGFTAVE